LNKPLQYNIFLAGQTVTVLKAEGNAAAEPAGIDEKTVFFFIKSIYPPDRMRP